MNNTKISDENEAPKLSRVFSGKNPPWKADRRRNPDGNYREKKKSSEREREKKNKRVCRESITEREIGEKRG